MEIVIGNWYQIVKSKDKLGRVKTQSVKVVDEVKNSKGEIIAYIVHALGRHFSVRPEEILKSAD